MTKFRQKLGKWSLVAIGLVLVTVLCTVIGSVLMRSGVDLVGLDGRLQGMYDVFRLLHVLAWLLLAWRWKYLIQWVHFKQWLNKEDADQWVAKGNKIVLVFGLYILIVVIGPTRMMQLIV